MRCLSLYRVIVVADELQSDPSSPSRYSGEQQKYLICVDSCCSLSFTFHLVTYPTVPLDANREGPVVVSN